MWIKSLTSPFLKDRNSISTNYLWLCAAANLAKSDIKYECGLVFLTPTNHHQPSHKIFNLRLIHFRWMPKKPLFHTAQRWFLLLFCQVDSLQLVKRNPPSGNWWKPAMCTVKKSRRIKSIQRMKHSHKKLFYKCCVVLN